MDAPHPPEDAIPALEPGLTVLKQDSRHSTSFHQVALAALARRDGIAYWLDARNNVSTYLLHDLVDHADRLRSLRIARAFTAYQYHALVRTLVQTIRPTVSLVVSPVPADLFRDDDVPEPEDRAYLEAAMAILGELASIYEVPILVSTARRDALGTVVVDAATAEIEYDDTDLGYRFETEGFQTKIYWQHGYWQTTIPYWVDLLGSVEASPVASAHDLGLFGVEV